MSETLPEPRPVYYLTNKGTQITDMAELICYRNHLAARIRHWCLDGIAHTRREIIDARNDLNSVEYAIEQFGGPVAHPEPRKDSWTVDMEPPRTTNLIEARRITKEDSRER